MNIPYRYSHNFSIVYSGVGLEVNAEYEGVISTFSLVEAIYPNVVATTASTRRLLPRTSTNFPAQAQLAHEVTGYANFRKKYPEIKGKGIKIGILDSGLDYLHPAFGGCFKTKGCRITHGYDFIGDDFDGGKTAQPDADPMDTCNGHGTHVAGILAGNDGEFQGVAPEASLGVYRISGCTGETTSELIVKALELAHQDGMQVINLSIGTPSGFGIEIDSKVGNNLAELGVVVVSAAGNMGLHSMWMSNAPASGEGVVSVASSQPAHYYSLFFTDHSNNDQKLIRSDTQSLDIRANIHRVAVVHVVDNKGNNTACSPFTVALQGKVALVQRGGCKISAKAQYAMEAGAVAVLVYNVDDLTFAAFEVDEKIQIPVMCIEKSAGKDLVQRLSTGQSVEVSIDESLEAFAEADPDTVSWFSSWGPSTKLTFKPDITAPGDRIYSTIPRSMGYYALQSGTSMASPYIAGCFALLMEMQPNRTVTEYRSFLQYTTKVLLMPNKNYTSSPAQQGNGRVNMDMMAEIFDLNVTYTPCLFDRSTVPKDQLYRTLNVTIQNLSNASYTISISSSSSQQVTAFTPEGIFSDKPIVREQDLQISFDNSSVLPEYGTVEDKIFIADADIPNEQSWVVGGHLTLRLQKKDTSFRELTLSFMAMRGYFANIPVLPPRNDPYYPTLYNLTSGALIKQGDEPPSYTMENNDIPAIRYKQQFNTDVVRILICKDKGTKEIDPKDISTCRLIDHGYAVSKKRNYKESEVYIFSWTGGYFENLTFHTFNDTQTLYFLGDWTRPSLPNITNRSSVTWVSPRFIINPTVHDKV
ncbi:hypothetical protein IWQ62_003840 [Dispira parvispora]|uniref:Uncharacterized protein n=1 Tax=Dispira parvispora TaxID=1520584 RepID=A0A9W8AQ63_9FUNG|nr:hypothetical protein IWQ62_003840 [Dispira parvispora]